MQHTCFLLTMVLVLPYSHNPKHQHDRTGGTDQKTSPRYRGLLKTKMMKPLRDTEVRYKKSSSSSPSIMSIDFSFVVQNKLDRHSRHHVEDNLL